MSALVTGAGAVLGLGVGGFAGFVGGAWAKPRTARYWGVNAVVVALGFGLAAWGATHAESVLSLAGIGVLAGGLTGARYGFAEPFRKLSATAPVAGHEDPGTAAGVPERRESEGADA